MQVGASSSCFFPLLTEKSLDNVLSLGFKQAEVFFNTSSELEEPFVKELKKNADDHGAKILSVHPFSSALESNCIFADKSCVLPLSALFCASASCFETASCCELICSIDDEIVP